MGKTIERMRANPKADWQIRDVEKACREAGAECLKPAGGSHFKIRGPNGIALYVVPAHRRIKPRYIRELVRILDGLMNDD